MKAKIFVTLKKGVLDPQGKTIQKALNSLSFKNIEDVRAGKYFEIKLKKVQKRQLRKTSKRCARNCWQILL
jgi:phosphoribosylformylglycinamidine synthase